MKRYAIFLPAAGRAAEYIGEAGNMSEAGKLISQHERGEITEPGNPPTLKHDTGGHVCPAVSWLGKYGIYLTGVAPIVQPTADEMLIAELVAALTPFVDFVFSSAPITEGQLQDMISMKRAARVALAKARK